MSALATYVHDLNPVIFSINDVIKLRWYGMAYFLAFISAWWICLFLIKKNLSVLNKQQLSDCGVYVMIFGVFLGGRLGFIFFYMIPEQGWGIFREDPFILFKLWQGGMSSHGGILGLFFVSLWYSLRNKLSWTGLGDMACLVGAFGIFCGRIANFINGELYGRVAEKVPWAVKFPSAFFDPKLESQEHGQIKNALAAANSINEGIGQISNAYHQGVLNFANYREGILEIIRKDEAVEKVIAPYLKARHPSQIYEALLEGALLFIILAFLRLRFRKMPHGILTGVFFTIYPISRIIVEQFREPDHALMLNGLLTKGQFYSVFMLLVGVVMFLYVWYRERNIKHEGF